MVSGASSVDLVYPVEGAGNMRSGTRARREDSLSVLVHCNEVVSTEKPAEMSGMWPGALGHELGPYARVFQMNGAGY